MIVMKFGGTSMESAEALLRAAEIVRSRVTLKPAVVVSAMGKTTNKLINLAERAILADTSYRESAEDLRKYHQQEAAAAIDDPELLKMTQLLVDSEFDVLRHLLDGLAIVGELTPRSLDTVMSFGERLSSVIFSAVLNSRGLDAIHVDSRDILKTDDRHTAAVPDFKKTYKLSKKKLERTLKSSVAVMGGFIASGPDGRTTTLGRGGSDYSAAIFGAAIDAKEIEIWTDVDGMLTSDPRLLKDVHRIRNISFAEAAELAYFGAKVLHPSTVKPAIEKDIPVRILNSRAPEVEGTRIVSEALPSKNVVKAIACKRNITLVTVESSRMLMAYGFLAKVFEVFSRLETPVDVVSTSEVSVSLTIDDATRLQESMDELKAFADVDVEEDQGLISIVGEGLRSTPGVAARAFRSLESVNIRMISQGASKLNLSLVVSDADLVEAITRLHSEFFSEIDPEVFAV